MSEWMGDEARPLDAVIAQVRRHGVIGSVASTAHVMGGTVRPVGIAAALLTDGDQECIGFTIEAADRDVSMRVPAADDMHLAFDALALQLGDRPLAALLREAAALAERHFVALALCRAGGDAEVAASLLGIDRDRVARAGAGAGTVAGADEGEPLLDPDLPPGAARDRTA